MVSAVFYLVAIFCLSTCVMRQLSWRARGEEGVTPVLPALACLGFSLMFIAPETQGVASLVFPGLGRLLSNCFTLVAAYGFSEMLRYLYGRTDDDRGRIRTRHRLAILGAVLITLTVTFFLGERTTTSIGLFDYEDDVALTIYVLVYSLYLTVTLAQMLRLTIHAISRTRSHLRVSMTVYATGCLLGLIYSMGKIYTTFLQYLGTEQSGAERYCPGPFSRIDCTLAIGFPALSVMFIVIGLSVPFLVKAPGRLRVWASDARLARALRPLWRAMCQTLPHIALTSPDAVRGRVPQHDAWLRLYRRTVEVRDAALILQPYRSTSDTREHARRAERAGLSGISAAVAVEAADLATAIERYRQQAPPTTDPSAPAAPAEVDDVRAEARWLAQVSAAFARQDITPASAVVD